MTASKWLRRALACGVGLWLTTIQAATPARVVSTSPSVTETLFALGLGIPESEQMAAAAPGVHQQR